MELPKAEDYILTFETTGVSPLFVEADCTEYMPNDSLILCPQGTDRSYIAKETIARLAREATEFFADDARIRDINTRINALLDHTEAELAEYHPGAPVRRGAQEPSPGTV